MQAGEGVGVADSEVEIYGGAAAGEGKGVFAGAYGDAAGRLLSVGGVVADGGVVGVKEMGEGRGDGDHVGRKLFGEGVCVEELKRERENKKRSIRMGRVLLFIIIINYITLH